MTNPRNEQTPVDEVSLIRQARRSYGVTLSNGTVTDNTGEEIMPIAAHAPQIADRRTAKPTQRQYFAPMTTTAHAVAEALRSRNPIMGPSRLHSLLYFCQGHHLAVTGEPLFSEPIYATSEGVDVEEPAERESPADLTNGQLNTVGYVISRYGNLSPADLRTLARGSDPWQLAAARPEDPRVELVWIQDWFRRDADRVEEGEPSLSREQRAKLVERARTQTPGRGVVTTREGLLARIQSLRERSASAP